MKFVEFVAGLVAVLAFLVTLWAVGGVECDVISVWVALPIGIGSLAIAYVVARIVGE